MVSMDREWEEKMGAITSLFSDCSSPETLYGRLIELGTASPPLSHEQRGEAELVPGCQSRLILWWGKGEGGRLVFKAESDALISAGLVSLLVRAYSGEPPERVIMCKPLFIKELNLNSHLSPSRSNGLFSAYTKMQQIATKQLSV